MNKIWVIIISICIVFGIFSGNTEAMVEASLNVPKSTLDLLIKIGGLIIFYNGLFQIAIDSKMIKILSRFIHPLTRIIFKNIDKDSIVHEYVSANILANLLGLGIASTPMALKALGAMKEENINNPEKANFNMVTLVLINISAFTIFPLTIISVRTIYKAKINLELIPFFIVCSLILTIVSIIISRIWGRDYE